MFIRRTLALLALLTVAACTMGAPPPQTASTGHSPPLPREIERDVGGAYPSPALQSLVERVGQKLATGSGLGDRFRFYVLDQPLANAHALSSGYIFVTRGLLALLDDEDELAAAMGHEMGHVMQRHAAQREQARRKVIDAAVDAALVSGSVTVGRSVARSGLLALRRYSREQELEADRLGVSYLVRAGYRSDAMTTLIEKLQRQSALEERIWGQQDPSDPADQRSALSTHPGPEERLAALPRAVSARRPGGAGDRAGYLEQLDGMSVDDAPQEGFVRGPAFRHPILRLAFDAPPDFRLLNDRDGILGVGRDRSLLYFSCGADRIEGPLATWMRDQMKPTPTDIQAVTIGGAEAAIGARARGADAGLGQVRYVVVRHGDGVCYFNLLADGPDRDRRIELLVSSARTLRPLSESEAAALRPYRLRIVSGGPAPAQLAARLPYPELKMERLLTLNGVASPAELARLPQVKIVEP
ncbi:MAG: M48 family metalloprotease [Enhydrobacter sp.]|nr:MAG: M48 family metalloprotease [Enhydrobacter sp.]